jgi:hypothetical protein
VTPHRRTSWIIGLLLGALSLLSGCAAYDRSSLAASGPGSDFAAGEATTFREAQDALIIQLAKAAQPPTETATKLANEASKTGAQVTFIVADKVTWDQVIRAGMDYADVRCESYLHALYRLDRDRKTAVAQTGLLGGATAGVQAALGKAAKEVAIVAILFGLAGSTIDNVASNLLYQLEPSSVRSLVKVQQMQYRANLPAGYRDRPAAMTALRDYAVLCVPANIEAQVNLAVKKSEPNTKQGDVETGQPPVVTNATITVSTFAPDNSSSKLDAFVNPGGKLNKANDDKLLGFMAAHGVTGISTVTFNSDPKYADLRRSAAAFFKL